MKIHELFHITDSFWLVISNRQGDQSMVSVTPNETDNTGVL